jgi:hypothetical protein
MATSRRGSFSSFPAAEAFRFLPTSARRPSPSKPKE